MWSLHMDYIELSHIMAASAQSDCFTWWLKASRMSIRASKVETALPLMT